MSAIAVYVGGSNESTQTHVKSSKSKHSVAQTFAQSLPIPRTITQAKVWKVCQYDYLLFLPLPLSAPSSVFLLNSSISSRILIDLTAPSGANFTIGVVFANKLARILHPFVSTDTNLSTSCLILWREKGTRNVNIYIFMLDTIIF